MGIVHILMGHSLVNDLLEGDEKLIKQHMDSLFNCNVTIHSVIDAPPFEAYVVTISLEHACVVLS